MFQVKRRATALLLAALLATSGSGAVGMAADYSARGSLDSGAVWELGDTQVTGSLHAAPAEADLEQEGPLGWIHFSDKTLENCPQKDGDNGITNVEEKVAQTAAELNAANKTCAQLKEQIFSLKANDLVHQLRPLGNGEVLIERMEGIDAKALKDIAANIKAQKENSVVFLAAINQDKLVFVAGAGKGAIARGVRCGDLVKQAAMICGGNGGGKPDLAQAGGKDVSKLTEAFAAVENMLSETLSF